MTFGESAADWASAFGAAAEVSTSMGAAVVSDCAAVVLGAPAAPTVAVGTGGGVPPTGGVSRGEEVAGGVT